MSKHTFIRSSLVLTAIIALSTLEDRPARGGGIQTASNPNEQAQTKVLELFSASPAVFIENSGQIADSSVRYVFYGNGANIFHTTNGPVFQLLKRDKVAADNNTDQGLMRPLHGRNEPGDFNTTVYSFSANFVGAKNVKPIGTQSQQTKVNYYIGSDPNEWQKNVETFAEVVYPQIYDGIDLHTFGKRSHLKYEFHVAPGEDYSQILIRYEGIKGLSIDGEGRLHIGTAMGELVDDAPIIWQEISGQKVEIAGRYRLIDKTSYTFEITGKIDPGVELIIDPDLAWASFLGGSSTDSTQYYGNGVALDSSGNIFLTGYTYSTNFPTPDGFDTTYNGGNCDVFVAKVSGSGQLIWASFLGGSSEESGTGITVDSAGDALITGSTDSNDFPTFGGFDTSYNGSWDGFVAKVTATGQLSWSSYLGGSGQRDEGVGIAVDSADNSLITGWTDSNDFPTFGGFDTSYNGSWDGFVAKITATGQLSWSSYLGGSGQDEGCGIAVDSTGNALLTGWTFSTNFPTTGGFDTSYNGNGDVFVTKVTASGQIAWSTFLGGSGNEEGLGIAVDRGGNVLVTGSTESSNFPSYGGFDTSYNGGQYGDAFVTKVTASGQLAWSTFLGGSGWDTGCRVAVDYGSNYFVAGYSYSSNFPTPGGFDTSYNGNCDVFVAKVTSSCQLVWSSFLGGSGHEDIGGIAVDIGGNVLMTGYTESGNFPTPGGFDTSFNGGGDAFVAKISDSGTPPPTISGPNQIFVPTIARISPDGSAFVFPIKVKLQNNGPDITTTYYVHVRGSDYNDAYVDPISKAGPQTSDFNIQQFENGFDFVIPKFSANSTIDLEANLIFRSKSIQDQPMAGRMIWAIQGTIGDINWPSISGDPVPQDWTSGLSGRAWLYKTAIFPDGLPEDTSGVDAQGSCPTEVALGNGKFTASLSRSGKLVFAAFPTVGSYDQIPYETRSWDYCARQLTNDEWSHDFGAPRIMGIFPGIRIGSTGPVSWLDRDEWIRRGWQPRQSDWTTTSVTQVYRDLRERLEVQETAIVPFEPSPYGIVRIFDIKNLTAENQTVRLLCSALLNPNITDQTPYLRMEGIEAVISQIRERSNWKWVQTDMDYDATANILVWTGQNGMSAALAARWIQIDQETTPLAGVKSRYLRAGILPTEDIVRNWDDWQWDQFQSNGALDEVTETPLQGDQQGSRQSSSATQIEHGIGEWVPMTISPSNTASIALVLAFGKDQLSAKENATLLLANASNLADNTDTKWRDWLIQKTNWASPQTQQKLNTNELRLLARCLITQKMLQNDTAGTDESYADGSIIASPNLQPKYYPVWPRDAWFQSLGLRMAGLDQEANRLIRWLFQSGSGNSLPIIRTEFASDLPLMEPRSYWTQVYNPLTGAAVGLPPELYAVPGWQANFRFRGAIDIEAVEKDQVAISVLAILLAHQANEVILGVNDPMWSQIAAADRFLIENLQKPPGSGWPQNARLLEPAIDVGEDPRNDTAFWQWGNMIAARALELTAELFPIRQQTQTEDQSFKINCDNAAGQIRVGLEFFWYSRNGIPVLVDKLVYRDPVFKFTVNPSELLLNPILSAEQEKDRIKNAHTMFFWPFGFYPTDDAQARAYLSDYVWKLHDPSKKSFKVTDAHQGQPDEFVRQPAFFYFASTAINGRLLDDGLELIGDQNGTDISNEIINAIIGTNPLNTHLSEAGYVPEKLVVGFPGAEIAAVPLGWSHAMMAIALLQKAGYALPYTTQQPLTGDLKVKKCAVTAGKGESEDKDNVTLSGTIGVTPADLGGASEIIINISEVYSEAISISSFIVKNGKYTYTYKIPKYGQGAITSLVIDTNKQTFSLKVQKVDLTGLHCPFDIELEVGNYRGIDDVNESIVNSRGFIPVQLMTGFQDYLQIQSIKVKKGKSTDTLTIKGGIAYEILPTSMSDVVLKLDNQTFTIPAGSFEPSGKSGLKYVCKNATVLEGGTAIATFDLDKCTFNIKIKNTNVTTIWGKAKLNLAMGSFNEEVEVDLGG